MRRSGSHPVAVAGGVCYVRTTFGRRRLSAANKRADTIWVQGSWLYILRTYHPRKKQTDQPTVQMHTASLRKLNTTNETHQILVCADDVKLLGENIDRINRNTETMLYFGDEVSLEVN